MKGKLKESCPTCNHQHLKRVYEGPVRSAEPGSPYTDGYKVDECLNCRTIFLNPFPVDIKDHYEEGEYWKARTDDLNKKEFVNKFIREQLVWLNHCGGSEFTGESVLDVGCGHGIFLDVLKILPAEPQRWISIFISRNILKAGIMNFTRIGRDGMLNRSPGWLCSIRWNTLKNLSTF